MANWAWACNLTSHCSRQLTLPPLWLSPKRRQPQSQLNPGVMLAEFAKRLMLLSLATVGACMSTEPIASSPQSSFLLPQFSPTTQQVTVSIPVLEAPEYAHTIRYAADLTNYQTGWLCGYIDDGPDEGYWILKEPQNATFHPIDGIIASKNGKMPGRVFHFEYVPVSRPHNQSLQQTGDR